MADKCSATSAIQPVKYLLVLQVSIYIHNKLKNLCYAQWSFLQYDMIWWCGVVTLAFHMDSYSIIAAEAAPDYSDDALQQYPLSKNEIVRNLLGNYQSLVM